MGYYHNFWCDVHRTIYNGGDNRGRCPACETEYNALTYDISQSKDWVAILGYHKKKNPVYPTYEEWQEGELIKTAYVAGEITLEEATKQSEAFARKIREKYHPDYKSKPQQPSADEKAQKPKSRSEVPCLFGRIVAETTAQK